MVTDRVPLFGESHKHVSDKEEKKKKPGRVGLVLSFCRSPGRRKLLTEGQYWGVRVESCGILVQTKSSHIGKQRAALPMHARALVYRI